MKTLLASQKTIHSDAPWTVACPRCRARAMSDCRTPAGRAVEPHADRYASAYLLDPTPQASRPRALSPAEIVALTRVECT